MDAQIWPLGLDTKTAWNNEKFSFSQLFLWRIFTWYSMQKLVNYVIFVILCSFCSKLLRSNICFHFLPSELLVYNILLMEPIVPVTVKQSRMITHKLATKQNITKKTISNDTVLTLVLLKRVCSRKRFISLILLCLCWLSTQPLRSNMCFHFLPSELLVLLTEPIVPI